MKLTPVVEVERLPSELIQNVFSFATVHDLVSCDAVSRRFNELVRSAQQLWRYHCIHQYRYWHPRHEFDRRLHDPRFHTNWRDLFITRKETDRKLQDIFDGLVNSQVGRLAKSVSLVNEGEDAKDFLLRQSHTPSNAEDYLARTWWSEKILSQIQRRSAVQTWTALRHGDTTISLERALACVDLFVVPRAPESPDEVELHLDRIARRFEEAWRGQRRAEEVDKTKKSVLTLRKQALSLASFLRQHNLTGLAGQRDEEFYSLRNNLISIALCQRDHPSLPLISTAIYCAIARRVGLEAHPVNYPGTIHAIVYPKPASTVNLNGEPIHTSKPKDLSDDSYYLYLNLFDSDNEVSYRSLHTPLVGTHPSSEIAKYLGPCTNAREMLSRTANNLQNVREINMDWYDTVLQEPDYASGFIPPSVLDAAGRLAPIDIGGHRPPLHAHNMLQIIVNQAPDYAVMKAILDVHNEKTLDTHTITHLLLPLLPDDSESRVRLELHLHQLLLDDEHAPPPKKRADINNVAKDATKHPVHRVGTYFQHRKYHYKGVIVGWDSHCAQSEAWMWQMGVDRLQRARKQPFYPVLDHSGSSRYVAEENIEPLGRWQYSVQGREDMERVVPVSSIMRFAGEYMRRWDEVEERFVSNVREEYPEG